MIHTTCSSAEKYYALHPDLRRAIEYIKEHYEDISCSGFDGRHTLRGDDLFVLVGTHSLKSPDDALLEAHDVYIDVQVVIDGTETFGWASRESCSAPRSEFDTAKDIIFFDDAPTSHATVASGELVIFFPDDAHAPLMRTAGGGDKVRKAIIKIRVQ